MILKKELLAGAVCGGLTRSPHTYDPLVRFERRRWQVDNPLKNANIPPAIGSVWLTSSARADDTVNEYIRASGSMVYHKTNTTRYCEAKTSAVRVVARIDTLRYDLCVWITIMQRARFADYCATRVMLGWACLGIPLKDLKRLFDISRECKLLILQAVTLRMCLSPPFSRKGDKNKGN